MAPAVPTLAGLFALTFLGRIETATAQLRACVTPMISAR
jgi:hypothetical protein